MKIKLLGIDLAKNVFQLCALNQANKVLYNRTVRRTQLASTIAKLEPTTIAMEACSSAHYWGRTFETMGHKVLLVPAHMSRRLYMAARVMPVMRWPSVRLQSDQAYTWCQSRVSISRISSCCIVCANDRFNTAPPWPIRFVAWVVNME